MKCWMCNYESEESFHAVDTYYEYDEQKDELEEKTELECPNCDCSTIESVVLTGKERERILDSQEVSGW